MARWEVWRTINGRDFKYIDADDEKHAKKLAAYHTKMSTIYPYFAKEITDAESVPATARSVSESETRTDTTAAQSSGSRGHLEDTLPRRGRVGSDAMGEQGAESVGSEGALPAEDDESILIIDMQSRPNPEDARSLPYTAGSQTSKDAAGNAAITASSQRMKIWAFLSAYGPAMFEEIADGLNMYNNSVSTRLTQMRDAGMIDFVERQVIEPNGESHSDILTLTTRQGSQAAVFRALPEPWYGKPRRIRGRLSRYCLALKEIEALADVTRFPPSYSAAVEAIYNIAHEALGEG